MRVGVAGLGLIGGSIARGLARAGHHVTGLDRPGVIRRARRVRAIADSAPSPRWLARCDVVFLAATPRANLALLRSLAAAGHAGIVTDVGSVKGPICAAASLHGLDGFVGGHPMAGSVRAGFGASDAALFEGRVWILTPSRGQRPPRALMTLIRQLGARPVLTPPATHDRTMAFLSHVPQIVAWALADAAARDPVSRRNRHLAGPAYRDMTRLADSPRALWAQILDENRTEVRRALAALRRALERRGPR